MFTAAVAFLCSLVSIAGVLLAATLVLAFLGHLGLCVLTAFPPTPKRSGDWVAEVWIEWPICRGRPRYQQRFQTEARARLAAKLYAMALDAIYPRSYQEAVYVRSEVTRGWGIGTRTRSYDYGIAYGVRRLAPDEADTFAPQLLTRI